MTRTLNHPDRWKTTKFVSWPASWAKPMIRVPLPSGKYITRSVEPLLNELDTIERCKDVRDQLAIPIWGAKRWREILSVPARSVTRPRKDTNAPHNGVQLIQREGRADFYQVCWYELDTREIKMVESQTHGKRQPRRLRSKRFSFGTPNARFYSQDLALAEAIAFAKEKQREVYSVCHKGGSHFVG